MKPSWVSIALVSTIACGGSNTQSGGADAPIVDECTAGATQCTDLGTLQTCVTGPTGTTWSSAPCPSPSACLDGACVSQCTDECNLGDMRTGPSGAQTCQLVDLATQGPTTPGTGMDDRARLYNAYLRQWGMPVGQVAYMEYSAPDLATIVGYADQGDSALFTGTYLAAEALRYKATHSPDALANVTSLVQTLHMLWNVAGSGSPGWLARFAAPANSAMPILVSSFNATDPDDHFDATWNGEAYNWKGHVSRDQYQGVVMGYSLAYEVLTDESVRDLIRTDMVTFTGELMKTRSLCPTFDGTICLFPINAQYCVLTDKEPLNISVSGGSDALTGVQEFMPKLFGLYPQPAAAIQLTATFEVALQVTAGQAQWATQNQTLQTFFDANVDDWLTVAQQWAYSRNCGNSYYANNIAFEPMYDLARLDQDPTRSTLIRSMILEQKMWQNGVINDKNSWFAYIYAANAPMGSTMVAPAVTMANTQLAQFGPAPRVHVAVTNNLPADPSCSGQALDAIDVGQRIINDFDWQRGAWLESDAGNPNEVYPGVDYLAAYWLGRASSFLTDDTPSECTRWLP